MKIPKYAMNRLLKTFAESAGDGDKDIVQVLAPFIGNANATIEFPHSVVDFPPSDRNTPIQHAIMNGHTEIIKLLAPLCHDYNLQETYNTLIHCAVGFGQAEAIKILAPFMKNPNAGDPLKFARLIGPRIGPNDDVIRILEKLQ